MNKLVGYVRSAAKEDDIDLSNKTDEEIENFALAFLGANIEDAILAGLAETEES